MERHDQDRVRQGPLHGVEHLESEPENVVEVDHVGSEIEQKSHEIAFDVLGVPVGQQEMVVVVGMVDELALALAQAHQRRRAVTLGRVSRAGEVAGGHAVLGIQRLVQIVGGYFRAAERAGRVGMGDDENARGRAGHGDFPGARITH